MSDQPREVAIKATHPAGFRSGEWATVTGLAWINGRPCYQVVFPDGVTDSWVVDDPWDPYELRAGVPIEAISPLEDGYAVLRLDPNHDGSCPCAVFTLDDTEFQLHCWRTCGRCAGVGIHYVGNRAVAERIKPLLDAIDWYGEWPIREGFRRSV